MPNPQLQTWNGVQDTISVSSKATTIMCVNGFKLYLDKRLEEKWTFSPQESLKDTLSEESKNLHIGGYPEPPFIQDSLPFTIIPEEVPLGRFICILTQGSRGDLVAFPNQFTIRDGFSSSQTTTCMSNTVEEFCQKVLILN